MTWVLQGVQSPGAIRFVETPVFAAKKNQVPITRIWRASDFNLMVYISICKDLTEIIIIKATIKDSRYKFNMKIIRIHIK